MVTLRKVLFPTDFSEPSEAAWSYALALAKEFGAEILLLHVVAEPPRLAEAYEMGFTPERFIKAASDEARRQMTDMIAKAADWKVSISPQVRKGVEFREIIQAAREAAADIIVMGTHGRTGLAHALIGSVAEKVVRKAPCPVLTVKHPKIKFEMP
jgi:nucleotide-binding universal stress UspA family protein